MALFPKVPAIRMTAHAARLCEPYRAVIIIHGRRELLTVDEGFSTDGASIPRLLWRALGHPYQMPLLPCALAHDALYAVRLNSRSDCDAVFLDLMRRARMGLFKRLAVWLAVRAFGGWAWRHRTAQSIATAKTLCRLTPLG